jgi:hypothetical protein
MALRPLFSLVELLSSGLALMGINTLTFAARHELGEAFAWCVPGFTDWRVECERWNAVGGAPTTAREGACAPQATAWFGLAGFLKMWTLQINYWPP